MPVIGCAILAVGYLAVLVYLLLGGLSGPLLFALLGIGGLGLGFSSNTLIGAITSAMPTQYASDLSGVVATNAQLSGALGVAVSGSVYAAITSPPHALSVVLAGFAGLAVVGAVSARRLVGRYRYL